MLSGTLTSSQTGSKSILQLEYSTTVYHFFIYFLNINTLGCVGWCTETKICI